MLSERLNTWKPKAQPVYNHGLAQAQHMKHPKKPFKNIIYTVFESKELDKNKIK